MNPMLIISENSEAKSDYVQNLLVKEGLKYDHPDLLMFDEDQKIGVEEIKKIRIFLGTKPFQAERKMVVLGKAQNLTKDGQNALLKTLEEPPLKSQFILLSDTIEDFLPTILSRCQVINLKDKNSPKEKEFNIGTFLLLDLNQKFDFIAKVENKKKFLKEFSIYFEEKLSHDLKYAEYNKKILISHGWMERSGNMKAILEYLVLELPD